MKNKKHRTRQIRFVDPNGVVRTRTRRWDQGDPKYAILSTTDRTSWGIYRVTQNDVELLDCLKELLEMGQSAFVTKPEIVK